MTRNSEIQERRLSVAKFNFQKLYSHLARNNFDGKMWYLKIDTINWIIAIHPEYGKVGKEKYLSQFSKKHEFRLIEELETKTSIWIGPFNNWLEACGYAHMYADLLLQLKNLRAIVRPGHDNDFDCYGDKIIAS